MTGTLTDISEPQAQALSELVERLEMGYNPPRVSDPDWHSYMGFPLPFFLKGLEVCREALGEGEHPFLEVGSGLGSRLCLARSLGWDAEGLEIHHVYRTISRAVFPHCRVTLGDASTFEGYDKFDVVYAYRFANDNARQNEVNRFIADQLKPGALFWAPSGSGPYPTWLEHVDGLVWRKP